MKRFSPGLLALVACVIMQSDAFGQQHGNCSPRGSKMTSFWTKPLCPNSCVAKCCATKAYPDAGWAPPARLPVNYDGAWYAAYTPQQAYGTPGGGFIANYPTVYQPTDTAQMGYYYHKVPTWQTRQGMIPPTPNPSDYHSRVCPGGGSGCFGHHSGYAVPGNSCQNCNQTYNVTMLPQYGSADGRYVVRPKNPNEKQGLLGGFRLTSMTEVFN